MRKALLVAGSVAGAALLTAATVVVGLLFLMFSTGEEDVHKEGLFGSLFFETQTRPDGATGISMGVADPVGLVVIFVLFLVLLMLTQVIYRQLKQYRAHLIKEQANI